MLFNRVISSTLLIFSIFGMQNTAMATDVNYLSIPMYIHEEYTDLMFPMLKSQLTITPTSGSFVVRAISIQGWTSADGSCSGTSSTTQTVDSGLGNTVTLQQNKAYVTTDASLRAAFLIRPSGENTSVFQFDQTYNLLDNSLNSVASTCVQGTNVGNNCSSSTNCGWTSARSWTP